MCIPCTREIIGKLKIGATWRSRGGTCSGSRMPKFKGRTMPGIVPMIRIHSAKNKPADAFVQVHYRDTWFWIDDTDLPSKRSFAQLMPDFRCDWAGGVKLNIESDGFAERHGRSELDR
jgi:hypothetical protein